MFKDYPKHGYNFDSRDIDILRNQIFNLANIAEILGNYLTHSYSDEIVKQQTKCLKERVLPILNSLA